MKIRTLFFTAILTTANLAICKKTSLADSAIRKACEIITQTLFEASNSDEKAEVIKNVEEKWNIFSPTEEVDPKYKYLVVHAIKGMVSRADYRLCRNISIEARDFLLKKFNLSEYTSSKEIVVTNISQSYTYKLQLLKEMVQKIDALVNKALKNSTNDEEKQKTIDLIKKRVEDAFRKKEKPKLLKNKTSLYSGILSKGLDAMVNNSFKRLNIKNDNPEEMSSDIMSRRRNMAALEGIEHLRYKAPSPQKPKPTSKFKPMETDTNNSIGKDVVDNNISETVTAGPIIGLTKEYDCHEAVEATCAKLKDVSEFKCESDDTVIGVQQFCDGTVDCSDGSDEMNCVKHAVNKIHSASKIINDIDLARNCFDNYIDRSMLPFQGKVLTQLLKKQIAFIEKYTQDSTKRNFLKSSPYNDILEVVTEVVAIVKSFSLSLNTAICIEPNKEVERMISEGEKLLDAEPTFKTLHETLSDCDCNNQFCTDMSTCSAQCKRICHQTYSLTRWGCKAVKGGVGVGLDDLCNGQNDCYDETDESNCVPEYYEANQIFTEVLKIVKTYSMSKSFEPVRSRLISLHAAIRQLMKHSKGLNNNNMLFKIERDNIFSMLPDIYLDLVEQYDNMDPAEEMYELLLSVNEKLVRALKRSYTGNEKVNSIEEVCTCLDKKCTQANCTSECTRLCYVRDFLTTYPCRNSTGNLSVHVDVMCNGKATCPNGEDETNCVNEICRTHHLVVLRHNLQLEIHKFRYTALEGVLETWKEKANKRIASVEKSRISPLVYKILIQDILKDLAETYASNEELKGSKMINNERILNKYHELGVRIMELAKSCTK